MFYDLDAAKIFGEKVDFIAEQPEAMVPIKIGKSPKSILTGQRHKDNAEHVGKYHTIKKDVGQRGRDVYYVSYDTYRPRDSSRADVISSERQVKAYLDQQYQELGPDMGISLG